MRRLNAPAQRDRPPEFAVALVSRGAMRYIGLMLRLPLSFVLRISCVALGGGVAALAGCASGDTQRLDLESPEIEATPSAGSEVGSERWPRNFVAGPGAGPALYLNEDADSPALGYVSPGVPFELGGSPSGNRVPVRIRGDLKVRAWMASSRLAQIVQRRSKVRDTPTYVAPGDLVRILGPDEDPDRTRVAVTPVLGCEPECEPRTYEGSYPTIGLAPTPAPDDAEGPRPGTPMRVNGSGDLVLYDGPGGEVIATISQTVAEQRIRRIRVPIEQLVERDGWRGIRVGRGPYLVGFTNQALEPLNGLIGGAVGEATSEGDVPARLEAEADKPLWRLSEGTRVRFNGQTVGILATRGWAREMNRYQNTGEVDFFVAANDQLALRGMVRIQDLEPAGDTPRAPAGAVPADTSSAAPPTPAESSTPTESPTPSSPATP